MLEGVEELEPPRLPPEGEGVLGELRPPPPEEPPLLPDEPPDEPEDPPLELGGDEVGEGMDDDWLAQPPIRNAETDPTSVACTAIASSRFHE